jgi:hypothetical protein
MYSTDAFPRSAARPGEPALQVRAARPDLRPDASAFRAAVVLLAGPLHAFNIDRIAGRCGLPRAVVAACVRRLIDNGVWEAGTAVYPWSDPDDPRFWNDAAVAEGRLLRRTRPGGQVEWAPAGRWEKAFDYVGPQGDPGGALLYLDCAADPPRAAGPPAAPDGSPAAPGAAPPLAAARVPALCAAGGGWPGAPATDTGPAPAGSVSVPELFPGAHWLV